MFARIQHFINTFKTQWSKDAAARGAAKMTAGAVLIAEGVFGVVRGGRGRNGRGAGGLLGGVIGLFAGGVFVAISYFVAPEPPLDAVEAQGTIVDSVRGGTRDGKRMYSAVIAFEASDGKTYRFTESASSRSKPRKGSAVALIYSSSDPQYAYRTDGFSGWFPTIFFGTGLFIGIASFFSLLISLLLIAAGIVLFRQGRKDRSDAGIKGSFFADLISLAGKARSGDVDVQNTAVGQPDAGGGS